MGCSALTAKRLQLSTAWLCFWSLHWDRSSLGFMKCIFFFFVTNRFLGFSLPFFPASFVVEQPELSNSSDKSNPWTHYVSDHCSEIKQVLFISPSPCTFPLILFSLLSNSLRLSLLLVPSDYEPPLISFVGFDTQVLQVYCVALIILHLILLLAIPCSGGVASLFTGFPFHPCTTGLTTSLIMRLPWLFTDYIFVTHSLIGSMATDVNASSARMRILLFNQAIREVFALYVHNCYCQVQQTPAASFTIFDHIPCQLTPNAQCRQK